MRSQSHLGRIWRRSAFQEAQKWKLPEIRLHFLGQNRPNIDPKRYWKNDENKKASKMAKKSVYSKTLQLPGLEGVQSSGEVVPPYKVGETPPPPLSVAQNSPYRFFALSCPVLPFCLCFVCCPGLSCRSKVILGTLGKAFRYYKNSFFLALSYFKIRWENHETII